MGNLPKLKVDEIEWQLNENGNVPNFVGDDKIWKSIKAKQPNIKMY